MAWLGYEAPPIPVLQGADFGVLSGDYARAGATRLTHELNGVLAARAATGSDPFLSVTAHSYGSTTAANALTRVGVDSFTILGSAGIENDITRGELQVPDGQLFVAQAHEDPSWAESGRLGSGRRDPKRLDGVTEWHPVDAVIDGEEHHGTNVHETVKDEADKWGYLEQRTTSLYNTALAGLDLGDRIVPGANETSPLPGPPIVIPGPYPYPIFPGG